MPVAIPHIHATTILGLCCDLLSCETLFCLLATLPAAGESIPIRLFLAGYELTPTMRDINKKFSVRYYLNLVLIDEEERRYFKQQVKWGGFMPGGSSLGRNEIL